MLVAADMILRSMGRSKERRKKHPPSSPMVEIFVTLCDEENAIEEEREVVPPPFVKISVPSCGGELTAEEGGVFISLFGKHKIERKVQWAQIPPLLAVLKVGCDSDQPYEFHAGVDRKWSECGFYDDDLDIVVQYVPNPSGEKSLLEAVEEKWSEMAKCCPDPKLYEEIQRVVDSNPDDLLRYAEVFLR